MGDSAAALDFIADGIELHIVGDHIIDGNAAVKEMCEEAASQGKANFQNGRVIRGKNHIVVEGADLDTDIHYCDIYTIEREQTMENTS